MSSSIINFYPKHANSNSSVIFYGDAVQKAFHRTDGNVFLENGYHKLNCFQLRDASQFADMSDALCGSELIFVIVDAVLLDKELVSILDKFRKDTKVILVCVGDMVSSDLTEQICSFDNCIPFFLSEEQYLERDIHSFIQYLSESILERMVSCINLQDLSMLEHRRDNSYFTAKGSNEEVLHQLIHSKYCTDSLNHAKKLVMGVVGNTTLGLISELTNEVLGEVWNYEECDVIQAMGYDAEDSDLRMLLISCGK